MKHKGKDPILTHSGPLPPKQTRRKHASKCPPLASWVRLPKLVVHARAGLIPSEETDGNPPPDGLTVEGVLAWHRGYWVRGR
jgi:hypothetical protein